MEHKELLKRCRFPEYLDSSMLSTADSCKQKFFNEYILCITSHGRSPDLHAGGAFAMALELIRKLFYEKNVPLQQCYQRVFPHFVRYWGDFEPPLGHQKDFINTWMAVEEYFLTYPPDTDTIQPYKDATGKHAIEYNFSIPMNVLHPETRQPMLFVGRFDLLAYYLDTLVIVDEKTTKSLGSQWANQWDLRGQFLGYTFAVQHHGLPCVGALIRGIAIQKTQYKHAQVLAIYPQWQVERWWREANRKAQELINMWMKFKDCTDTRKAVDTFTHSYGEACTAYGRCPYAESICTVEEPWNWYDTFERRVWNPLDKDPTHEALLMEEFTVDLSNEVIQK